MSAGSSIARIRELDCGTVICAERYVPTIDSAWFDREFWRRQGAHRHTSTGRSPVLILDRGDERWVLRHYRRGGVVARFVDDHYWFTGLRRTRAFKEWWLLQRLGEWGLPAPAGIAACVRRQGCIYQADIITRFLPDTRALSAALKTDGVPIATWRRIGCMLRRFHERGVDHPDLTAHNVLLGRDDHVYLVDFDNAAVRRPGRWRQRGLARFQRSLRKVALETGTQFTDVGWRAVLEGYAEDGS